MQDKWEVLPLCRMEKSAGRGVLLIRSVHATHPKGQLKLSKSAVLPISQNCQKVLFLDPLKSSVEEWNVFPLLRNREICWEGCAFQNCQWSGTTAKPPGTDLRRVLKSALLPADYGLTSPFYG